MKLGSRVWFSLFVAILVLSASFFGQTPEQLARASEFWKKGVEDYQAKRFDSAILNFNEYIKIRPEVASGWYNRGISYYERASISPLERDFRQAISDLSQAIKINAKKVDYWLWRGRTYQKLITIDLKNSSAAAISDFTEVLRLEPKNGGAFSFRGQVYYEIGQYDKAMLDLNAAIRLKPDDAVPYYYRAMIYGYRKNYTLSRRDIEKALSIYPNYELAKNYRDFINTEAKKAQPPTPANPTVASKPPVVTKPVETPIADAREGYTRADTAEKAGDHRKTIDVVSKTLPLIAMRSEGVPTDDVDTFVYLDLLKKQARAYFALKLYKEGDEAYKKASLAAISNMNAFITRANQEMDRDRSGSGAGLIMASTHTSKATITCRSTFASVNEWLDALKRDRPTDSLASLSASVMMGAVREMCAMSFFIDGSTQHSKIYTYTGNSIKTKQLNTAIERYTEAINYLKVYRPAYEARAKAYRELGRADLAIADEQKAATLPLR